MKPKHIFLFTALLLASFVGNAQTVLWATATQGSATGQGTILQADSTGTNFHSVYSFVNALGAWPLGNLVLSNNGNIYGVTYAGGFGDSCVIFTYDPSTGIYTKIYDYLLYPQFGHEAKSGLVEGPNNFLYGTCSNGGQYGGGVLYRVDPSNNSYLDIHDFKTTGGHQPQGTLLVVNGIIYGMTSIGGLNNEGIIFSFDPLNNVYLKKYSFVDSTGGGPVNSGFIQASNGKLYGMTFYGGANSKGVIFSYDYTNNLYTDVFDFAGYNGEKPYGSLIQASDSLLYGMTSVGGINNYGVIFSFDINTSNYTVVYYFDIINGFNPRRSLIQATNGKLLGTTYWGGLWNRGVIFSFDITNNSYTKIYDYDVINGSYPDCDILETPAIPTALQTFSSNKTFSIYPNPAINSITINGGHSPVEFVDVYGRVIKTLTTDGRAITTVDVTQFPNVFFVRDGDGLVKKIVRR